MKNLVKKNPYMVENTITKYAKYCFHIRQKILSEKHANNGRVRKWPAPRRTFQTIDERLLITVFVRPWYFS